MTRLPIANSNELEPAHAAYPLSGKTPSRPEGSGEGFDFSENFGVFMGLMD
jgi:hypothetical protein